MPSTVPVPSGHSVRAARRLLLFTKPARAGRVKTRLIGDLNAEQAADLHAAFTADLVERLRGGDFELMLAWALDPEEPVPAGLPGNGTGSCPPGVRQEGDDLGRRLFAALSGAASGNPATMDSPTIPATPTNTAGAATSASVAPSVLAAPTSVAAVGSDHPTLSLDLVHRAFELLEEGAEVVLGPAEDGGYYLIALRAGAVAPRLFEEIPWSTAGVLESTLARCRELGLATELLPEAPDVDTPEDLRRLAVRLAARPEEDPGCPRTRALLAAWGMLPPEGAPAR